MLSRHLGAKGDFLKLLPPFKSQSGLKSFRLPSSVGLYIKTLGPDLAMESGLAALKSMALCPNVDQCMSLYVHVFVSWLK